MNFETGFETFARNLSECQMVVSPFVKNAKSISYIFCTDGRIAVTVQFKKPTTNNVFQVIDDMLGTHYVKKFLKVNFRKKETLQETLSN